MIEVQNLTKAYGPVKAVDGISFEVKTGEIVGFLGPNGAGKTTTMKILTCFIGATSGNAAISGFDVEKHSLDVRSRVGYLPESAPLYTDMDVIGFLRFVAEVRGLSAAKLASRLDEVVSVCGLKNVLLRPISQLSKGYKQRVGLAQAIIHDPEVLILDEPTSGLDPNQIIEIRELIRNLGKQKTVILSTHILPEVEAVCDRVIIINEGRIVAQGTLSELRAHSQESVETRIRGERASVEAALKGLPGVQAVRVRDERDGLTGYTLTPARGARIAESVFALAAKSGWGLSELKTEGASLEDVFTRLTRSAS